jgi:hypothetical protein
MLELYEFDLAFIQYDTEWYGGTFLRRQPYNYISPIANPLLSSLNYWLLHIYLDCDGIDGLRVLVHTYET